MNIIITGTRELSAALAEYLSTSNTVHCLDRTKDINDVAQWGNKFVDVDCIINCAYDGFGQLAVLDHFACMWANHPDKTIINIGSIVSDYPRSEKEKDGEYFPYRIHKQALQKGFSSLVRDTKCSIKLINLGPFESEMSRHIKIKKLTSNQVCRYVDLLLSDSNIKRIDVWQ